MSKNTKKTKNKLDPELDFFSESFNPIKALLTPQRIPVPDISAGTSKNVRKFESELKRKRQKKKEADLEHVRKFEEHQKPIQIQRKELNNVMTRMEKIQGPLKSLRDCSKSRIEVKIITRRGHEPRGELYGTVTAFDKHWNVTLENVREIWKRPKKIKSLLGNFQSANFERSLDNNFVFPKVEIVAEDTKYVTCQRFLKQLFVRGEHIVLIVVTTKSPTA